MKTRILWLGATLALTFVITGCGGSGRVEVSGRVVYQGKGVPSTQVSFFPEDGSRRSTAVTDDDGNFRLRYSRDETGVVTGKHTVVLKYIVGPEEELHKIPPKASKEQLAVIAKFKDLKTSTLHFDITSGGQFIEVKLD
jgi:hypothetical protein